MEQTECSETSAHKIQTPGNYPEENIQHTEHGESLKSRKLFLVSYDNSQFKILTESVEDEGSARIRTTVLLSSIVTDYCFVTLTSIVHHV
jgi:hypothetical protein